MFTFSCFFVADFSFCQCFHRQGGYFFRNGKRCGNVRYNLSLRLLPVCAITVIFRQALFFLVKRLHPCSSSSSFFSIFSIPGALLPSAVPNVISDNALSTSTDASTTLVSYSTSSPVFVPTPATTTSTATLPGGLSGTTTENGVSLNDSEILYWTNIARSDNGGLAALNEDTTLDKIATIRVEDMFAEQYFDHYSPTGDNVSLEANANGYSYITIGENIALGNFGSSRDLVTAWINRPGHRANILNTGYTEIGVAAEQGIYQGSEI